MKVTVFNVLGEDESGNAICRPMVFDDAIIEIRRAANPVLSGERNGDNFRLYLFSDRNYLPPDDYRADPDGHWTLNAGDAVAVGEHTEIPQRPFRINTVHTLYADGHFHHWEVSGRGQLLES